MRTLLQWHCSLPTSDSPRSLGWPLEQWHCSLQCDCADEVGRSCGRTLCSLVPAVTTGWGCQPVAAQGSVSTGAAAVAEIAPCLEARPRRRQLHHQALKFLIGLLKEGEMKLRLQVVI
jgi:hypothetical protein